MFDYKKFIQILMQAIKSSPTRIIISEIIKHLLRHSAFGVHYSTFIINLITRKSFWIKDTIFKMVGITYKSALLNFYYLYPIILYHNS